MDRSLVPSLIWIGLTIVGLAMWRTNRPMARHAVMGASGSLGIWLLERDWTMIGAGLLGLGVVLLVVNVRADRGGPVT